MDEETIRGKKGQPELTCALCGECVGACPARAIHWRFVFDRSPKIRAVPAAFAGKKMLPALINFKRTILDPERVFIFSAFTFSVIISGKFSVDALNRIGSLVLGG
jgi:polyferredoxin